MPTIFASTPKWPSVSTSLRPIASWSRGSGPLSPFPFSSDFRRRRPVVDLLRFGHAPLLPHRGQGRLLGLGVGADAEPLLSADLDLVGVWLKVLGDVRGRLPGILHLDELGRRRLILLPVLGDRHGRFEVVVLRIGAHHVGRAGLGLEGPEARSLRRSSRCWIAVWATPRPPAKVCRTPRPTPRKTVEIEVPVTSIAPIASISTVAIRRSDLAEEVLEPGLEAVADLATVPAEEEDEAEVDAGGDQEEADQVEMALLQPLGQMRPWQAPFGLRFRLWACGARPSLASCARTRHSLRRPPCLPCLDLGEQRDETADHREQGDEAADHRRLHRLDLTAAQIGIRRASPRLITLIDLLSRSSSCRRSSLRRIVCMMPR